MKKVTAIFDIGKTNKKLFLFDKNFKVVYSEYQGMEEIKDEDGDPCDDINAITEWIKSSFNEILKENKYDIVALNFSTYGASLIHLDENGELLTPLYNYTKPIDQKYIDLLYNKHGGVKNISQRTASPPLAMLNSGVQLFWLKHHKPKVFAKIKYSLHLPQYLSYLFTGIPVSDYTSIGCHTMLWDYEKRGYHDWVIFEGIDKILAPITDTRKCFQVNIDGKNIKVGIGIHDSSSALLPYLLGDLNPFILISTGTWSITLNPFNTKHITHQELGRDCLNYMSIDGNPVRASRLFLGNEYKIQLEKLNLHFGNDEDSHKTVKYSKKIYDIIKHSIENHFHFENMFTSKPQTTKTNYKIFDDFETAYHQLMHELMEEQIASLKLAIGNTSIKTVYIDGGFINNDIYINLISLHLKDYTIKTTKAPLGSAIGAALVIKENLGEDFRP